ncbi:MAG TPA: cupin domain-containing protein [Dehalococcoidia bacterium]|nr:cupin domain-containing protein [Dehalococcoidia bacterium]
MQSRYEKLIVRKPSPPPHEIEPSTAVGEDFVPTGVRVLCDKELSPETSSVVEYNIIDRDTSLGNRPGGPQPHKHEYSELLFYLGTNPGDPDELGGEIELWLGEGKELEKVTLTTSSSILIPAGLAHLPLFYKNVYRPIIHVLVMFDSTDYDFIPVSREGRPVSE